MKSLLAFLCLVVLVSFLVLVLLPPAERKVTGVKGILSFSSAEEFRAYLDKTKALPLLRPPYTGGFVPVVEAVSVDEPDIVKTDGLRIYSSHLPPWYEFDVKVVLAYPPQRLSLLSEIVFEDLPIGGSSLLLCNDTLVVLVLGFNTYDRIYGYDVSDPANPYRKFAVELNGNIVGARLHEGKVYVIAKSPVDYYKPCPFPLLTINGEPLGVECWQIYRPARVVPVDSIYTIVVLDPKTGRVEKSISFVEPDHVYMSKRAIYVIYIYGEEDGFEVMARFHKEKCRDILSGVPLQA